MSVKALREALCAQQVHAAEWPPGIASAVDVLIDMIDRHRPLGVDGKHGDLHTLSCGCCEHSWADVTEYQHRDRHLICTTCRATRQEPR